MQIGYAHISIGEQTLDFQWHAPRLCRHGIPILNDLEESAQGIGQREDTKTLK